MLLSIEDLHVEFGGFEALSGMSLQVRVGEKVGIVGESGAGKSVMALAIMGLLPDTASVAGSIELNGHDILGDSEEALCDIRGQEVAMVFQDPMTGLNPSQRVGRQIAEMFTLKRGGSFRDYRPQVMELLEMVQMPDATAKVSAYPHELSGGQRQRVMIAMAIALKPSLLLADEPTTALDATVQVAILQLLNELVDDMGASLVLITHDLPVVASVCDRIVVMYGGRVMESGVVESVLKGPRHPYSAGLLDASPARRDHESRERLRPIEGRVPPLGAFPSGCPFRDRCPDESTQCAEMPPWVGESGRGSGYACWHPSAPSAR